MCAPYLIATLAPKKVTTPSCSAKILQPRHLSVRTHSAGLPRKYKTAINNNPNPAVYSSILSSTDKNFFIEPAVHANALRLHYRFRLLLPSFCLWDPCPESYRSDCIIPGSCFSSSRRASSNLSADSAVIDQAINSRIFSSAAYAILRGIFALLISATQWRISPLRNFPLQFPATRPVHTRLPG